MLELSNLSISLDAGLPENKAMLLDAVVQALNIEKREITYIKLLKRSIDARKKKNVHFVVMLGVELLTEAQEQKALNAGVKNPMHLKKHNPSIRLSIPKYDRQKLKRKRPVVVGMGPAGLFAALYLAKAGMQPLVVERGRAVEQRLRDVEDFNRAAPLNLQSNIQFGEGGAGTFSDGKLTTNTKNPYSVHVLQWFVDAGAPEEILWQAKPHIGTDRLVEVVRTMREQIIELGGEVHFETQMVGINFEEGRLKSIELQSTKLKKDNDAAVLEMPETIETHQLILATGHSARDTFALLHEAKVHMEQKPFSVGVRIEHEQAMIDQAQYGDAADHPALGAADYKLAVHLDSGRSVYSFCMCPGGEVVCASSEPETVAVNGMSRFARDAKNANSAIMVNVGPDDFESDHPLAGVEFQRDIETAAYREAIKAGGAPYQAPAQKLESFLAQSTESMTDAYKTRSQRAKSFPVRTATDHLAKTKEVEPSYKRGVVFCDLHNCLPRFVTDALEASFSLFDRKLKGFADPQAVLTGVETRSSSPVRICRNECFQVELLEGIDSGFYPCGEGAGYAGGIMSSAVDGLRIAEFLCRIGRTP